MSCFEGKVLITVVILPLIEVSPNFSVSSVNHLYLGQVSLPFKAPLRLTLVITSLPDLSSSKSALCGLPWWRSG